MASDAPLLHDPATTGVIGVLGTAILAWLGQRLLGKAAIETALRETTKEILEQLRTELRVAIHERDAAREESEDRRVQIEELKTTISALEVRLAARQALPFVRS